jgi:hypothetical protein
MSLRCFTEKFCVFVLYLSLVALAHFLSRLYIGNNERADKEEYLASNIDKLLTAIRGWGPVRGGRGNCGRTHRCIEAGAEDRIIFVLVVVTICAARVAVQGREGGEAADIVTVVANNALGVTLGGAVLAVAVLVRGHLATARQSLSGLKRCAADGLETNEAIHDGLI